MAAKARETVLSVKVCSMVKALVVSALVAAGLFGTGMAAEPSDAVKQACQADVQKFCANVQPGGGAVTQCMRSHALGLSHQCRAAWVAQRHAQSSPGQASNSAEP
jgi:hypothetical protein